MKIDKNDILTLSDNNQYIVLSKIYIAEEVYLYLVDILNNYNIKIVKLLEDSIIEVEDSCLLDKLIRQIVDDLK